MVKGTFFFGDYNPVGPTNPAINLFNMGGLIGLKEINSGQAVMPGFMLYMT
jgi:hypothetical protein